ncbi:AsmA family protein [Modicisalibacter tunisiensis]|uniref:AsmA family protein n=1 Tax=Modicisalibacter tunisiensis TaxID=390637 RepID=A0ABS7WZA6_9GAMM|nr:AsmA family protein [Modicisalibacter tunisiensis]MBZ9567201.1 AsmA family protein [Modicisalibacter tunisiensis]
MKRLVRILLAAVGVLGLVVVAAVVYVTTFFDPNELKPRLVEAVHEQTGLDLALDGPLNWSFYPRIGVSVEDARAWLPDQQRDDEAFAAIDRGEVSLAFAPLLSGEIAIDGLTLNGLRLSLERDAQGHGNWEQLLERFGDAEGQPRKALAPASSGPAMQGAGAPSVALDIASIAVRDGQVHYLDRRSGLDVTVRDFALDASDVNPASAFPLQASFVVDGTQPAVRSQVKLKSKARLGLQDGRYVLEGLALQTTTDLPAYPDRQQTLDLDADSLIADTRQGRYRLDGAEVDASLAHPALGESPLSLKATFAAEADTDAATARLNDLAVSGDDGLELNGNLAVSRLDTTPRYTGKIELAPLSLRPWLTRMGLPPATADDKALSKVALNSPIQGDMQQATLTSLKLVVDDTTFTGSLGAGLDGQSLTADLQGGALDLDRYLPPTEATPGKQADTAALLNALGVAPAYAATEAAQGADLVPVDTLRTLAVDGKLSLDSLVVKGMTLEQPSLALHGRDGQFTLQRLDARLYDGTLHAEAGLDVRRTPIHWRFSDALDGVQLVPLVEDYSGKPSPLRGRLNVSGNFTSRTNRADTLLRNLNGKADFRVVDGAVFNVNVSKELCTAVAALEGEATQRDWSPDTRFDQLKGSARVVDGVVHNDDLLITLPGIEMTGKGRVNLPTQRFDYDARARFVDTADAACKVNPRLEKVPLPVHCEGELSGEPGQWCAFDRQAFQKALTSLAKDEAKKKAVDKLNEKLDEKLGGKSSEELRNAIRGLLK